ncbi:Uncharacterised protein [Burkholderia pseudomallei]|nr:Uncharacterised protein [Burkholderia pseudomallei]CAJ9558356.1 Uncharacterised protein [Burkholderia pseudomallei]VBM58188.1 Uncharacterised protein [Burkholderia pseudomallei]
MYDATTTFSSAVTRKIPGMLTPAFVSSIAISADTIMKSAFRMLFAAMIRARCVGALRLWISA